MWNLAWEREMAIWFQVAVRLKEEGRRNRWRIIARKLNRFVRKCCRNKDETLISIRRHARSLCQRHSLHHDDDPYLTGMPCIGNGASSNTQLHPTPAAHPSGAAMPSLANALLANGIIDRWTKSWDPRDLRFKSKRRILETEAF